MKIHLNAKVAFLLYFSFVLLIAIGVYIWYTATYHTVSFQFKSQPMSITVVDATNQTVADLPIEGSVVLANGKYQAKPSGKNLDTSPIPFTVDGKDSTVVLNPPFSTAYFSSIIDEEIKTINAAIIDTYPKRISKYDIKRGELQQRGDWYITTLVNKSSTNDNPKDIYKIILKKEDGQWVVVDKPVIVPTVYNFPDVPKSIVKNAYNL